MPHDSKIRLALDGPVARVTLNDPGAMNALSERMIGELRAVLPIVRSRARVMVLSGAGGHFCSGASLSPGAMVGEGGADLGAVLDRHFNPLVRELRELDIPWITSVSGAAAGGGCALALMGDLVVASETAYFLQAFRRIGLVPDSGSTFLLTRTVGRVRAMEMMLLGERLPASTALEWGLVNRVVPAPELEDATNEIARKLAAGPTGALSMTRKLAWEALETGFDAALDLERDCQAKAGRGAEFAEGIRAFQEKRPARFSGS